MFNHPKDNIKEKDLEKELLKLTDIESGEGFLYFLLNYVYMPDATKGVISMKDYSYKWQQDFAKNILQNRYIIFKKMRQIGASTTTGAYALYRMIFFKSQSIYIISKSQRESSSLLKKIKIIYNHLPLWLRQEKSGDAKTLFEFKTNDSFIASLPNKSDPIRGESASVAILDELAYYNNAKDIMASTIPALTKGSLTPFTNQSLPSQALLISTYPYKNIADNKYVELLNEARMGENAMNLYMMEIETDDIPEYKDENWHKEQYAMLGKLRYEIEVLGQEPFDSEDMFIPAETFKQKNMQPITPLRVDFVFQEDVDEEGYYKDLNEVMNMKEEFDPQYNYIKGLHFWENPYPGKHYIIVADVATGRANDFSAFHVFDLETFTQVAEYKSKINIEYFKNILEIITKYYNEALLSIESNTLGESLCQYFGETKNYKNFYWHLKNKKNLIPGFPVSSTIRSNMIISMQSKLINEEIIIKGNRTIHELRNFGFKNNGRIEAMSGNDDLVMSLAQYCYLIDIGFAATNKQLENNLIFGEAIKQEKQKEDDRVRNIKRYFDNFFDIDEEDITPHQKELMGIVAATDQAFSEEEKEYFNEQ